jgi:rhodanese-related sulfurtransferase
MTKTIERDELRALITAGDVTVVETLRSEHFASGHLPGAIHLHFEAPDELIAERLPDPTAAIVTYCSNPACRNSEIMANRLRSLGYRDVRKYGAGKDDWTQAGLELEMEVPA